MLRVLTILSSSFLLSGLLAAPLQSQGVRGHVVDSLTGAAIGKGFVVVLDDYGVELGRALTSSTGQFAFNDLAPGQYRLRSERIGYRARETDLFELDSGQTLEYTLVVTSIPVQLAGIDVRGERRCGSLEEAPEFGDLWEEARKALRAASWSADHQRYFYRMHVYRRVMDARRRDVLEETVEVESGAKWVPYVSWATDSLLHHGYVVQRSGLVTYYGPDANVLLDATFHASHCFRAVRGEKEYAGMLGLAFEPIPDREQSDIAGTVWVDERSSELRNIEYSYTGLSFNDLPSPGGTISFARMPSGAWIIVRWEIRAPLTTDLVSLTGHQRQKALAGFRDIGEEVIEITDMLGNRIYRPPDVTVLHGTVYDSVRGRILGNERVRVVGTGYQVTTQDDGTFEIPTLLEGEYHLTTARMDSLGYSKGNIKVKLVPADTVVASLIIPSLTAVHKELCGRDDGSNVLVGTLLDPVDAEPVHRAQIIATWTTQGSPTEEPRQMRQAKRSDRSGRFVLCRLPSHEQIALELRHDDFEIDPTVVEFLGDNVRVSAQGFESEFPVPERIWRLDLPLGFRP